ncbi:MAG: 3-deoxy-7-phosphoheptulonate synthase, partial [Thermomicrobiales bacterium]
MLVIIAAEAPETTRIGLLAAAAAAGLEARQSDDGHGQPVIGVSGDLHDDLLNLPGIVRVLRKHKPYMLASREHRPHAPSIVMVGDVRIGGGRPVVMAGPCVIEDRASLIETAHAVKAAGAEILRGGAFKPRTSPYAFQGLGEEGLRHLASAREATGMPVVTEVMEPDQVGLVAGYADMLQIGARNMA